MSFAPDFPPPVTAQPAPFTNSAQTATQTSSDQTPSTGVNPSASSSTSTFSVTYATTPPSSPKDGDYWQYVDNTSAATVSWMFRYVAAEATYNWVFAGGAPLTARVDTKESTTASSYTALTTTGPSVTFPFTGEYYVFCGSQAGVNIGTAPVDHWHSYRIEDGLGGIVAAPVDQDGATGSAWTEVSISSRWTLKTVTGGYVAVSRYRNADNTSTITYEARWINTVPLKVA